MWYVVCTLCVCVCVCVCVCACVPDRVIIDTSSPPCGVPQLPANSSTHGHRHTIANLNLVSRAAERLGFSIMVQFHCVVSIRILFCRAPDQTIVAILVTLAQFL